MSETTTTTGTVPGTISGLDLRGFAPISPDQLRAMPQMPKEAWVKALLEQAANALEEPEIKEKVIGLIKKAIPGRVFDGFADNIFAMMVTALRTL